MRTDAWLGQAAPGELDAIPAIYIWFIAKQLWTWTGALWEVIGEKNKSSTQHVLQNMSDEKSSRVLERSGPKIISLCNVYESSIINEDNS